MFVPSAPIESVLTAATLQQPAAEAMRAMQQRESEFPNPLAAKLTGLVLEPQGREVADQVLDAFWSDAPRRHALLHASGTDREIVIGAGFHAAVYAATRVLGGY